MVELKVSLEKKHVWLLALLIAAVGLVIAGGHPNPGHEISQIGAPGELDAKINGLVDTKLAGTKLKVRYDSEITTSSGEIELKCKANEFLLGGGCGFESTQTESKYNRPTADFKGWKCFQYAGGSFWSTKVYVICGSYA